MKKNKILKAFTLIELMVIIAIIGILVGAGSQINLNNISDKNKLAIFTNSIISQFETIRNDTLLGKGVDASVGVPDSWKLTYDTSGSGSIKPSYFNGAWLNYPSQDIIPTDFYGITDIRCLDIAQNFVSSGALAEVNIRGNDFTLAGACSGISRILEFKTRFRNDSNTIQINTLNGLIEIK